MTTILNSTAVDFHSSKIIKLVFIEKQDAKAYVQYDNIILILKNHQLVNICSVESLMHQKHTSTSRNAIYFWGGNGRRDWKSLISSVMTDFLKRDLKQIWETVQSQW